jgi:hypothetical protein
MCLSVLNVPHTSTARSSLHLRLPSTFGFPLRFRCHPGHNSLQDTPVPIVLFLCRTPEYVCGVHRVLTHRVTCVFPAELLGRHLVATNNAMKQSTWSVKQFSAVYGTRSFVSMFAWVRHWSMSWTRWLYSTPCYRFSSRSVLMPFYQILLGSQSGFFPSGFPTKTLYAFFL